MHTPLFALLYKPAAQIALICFDLALRPFIDLCADSRLPVVRKKPGKLKLRSVRQNEAKLHIETLLNSSVVQRADVPGPAVNRVVRIPQE